MADITQINNKNTIIYNYNNRQLPQPKKNRKSGGYYLSSIGGIGSKFKRSFSVTDGLGTLQIFMLLLVLVNFVRLVFDDHYLTFTGLLNGLQQIKTIPTDWISDLSYKIRDAFLGKVSGNVIAENILQVLSNLILPLPTILYILVGVLNVIWWLTSLLSILLGSAML